jgi:hypothetical protein
MTQMEPVIAAAAQAHTKDTTTVPAQAVLPVEVMAILMDRDCRAWTWESMRLLTGLRMDVEILLV